MSPTPAAPLAELDFGLALDPFRPRDITPPPGATTAPPTCPTCKVFVHPVDQNPAGDVLFECLATCGYQAVYRITTKTWTPRPHFNEKGWKPPVVTRKVQEKTAAARVTAKALREHLVQVESLLKDVETRERRGTNVTLVKKSKDTKPVPVAGKPTKRRR